MENTNNPQENKSNDEKTVVFGASTNNDDSNTDKTTINNNSDKTEFQDSASSSDKSNANEKEFSKDSKTISKPDTKKASTGVFVAAAGVAGVASGLTAGTIFSEDIKNTFSSETFDAPESPEDEIQDVTNSVETDNTINTSDNSQTNSFEASSTDANGNTYTVSLVDTNADGQVDFSSGEAHMVDGSSVSFTATGDALNSIFNNDVSIANTNDYASNPHFVHIPTNISDIHVVSDTMSYEIQSGDTLSEIAAAHHTSIEHLMELNPDISDPNMIYAGHNIVIPTNDNISNPYEGFQNYQNNDSSVIASNEGGFENMDWASFNDEPVSMDDYSNVLAQSDFDSFETPSNYLESGNDFISSEFI
jgi:LysM repeat protein